MVLPVSYVLLFRVERQVVDQVWARPWFTMIFIFFFGTECGRFAILQYRNKRWLDADLDGGPTSLALRDLIRRTL